MTKLEKAYCEKIKSAIDTNDHAVEKAILIVYRNQTAEEQSAGDTRVSNGIGFTGVDGEFLSSLGSTVMQGRHLSPKQIEYGRKKIRKYARQLLIEAKRTGKFVS